VKYKEKNCPLFVGVNTDSEGFNQIYYPQKGKINIPNGRGLILGCSGAQNVLVGLSDSSMTLTCDSGQFVDGNCNKISSSVVGAYRCTEPNKPHFRNAVVGNGKTQFEMFFQMGDVKVPFMDGMLDKNFNALFTHIVQVRIKMF